MNRPFWSRRIETDPCESIEPLLPLYADRAASPEEVRRVDAHLPGCERCREALSWVQATHRALAARPIALPPADLRSRIAQAIADSSAVPPLTPGLLRPARSFVLRPAHAAAASLVVVGLALSASYSFWHTEDAGVKPAPQLIRTASAPPGEKPHLPAVPHFVPKHSRIASVAPQDKPALRPVVMPRKAAPSRTAPKEQIADSTLVPVLHSASARLETVRRPAAMPHVQLASVKAVPIAKRQLQADKVLPAPKPVVMPNAPLLARHDKEPILVPDEIKNVTAPSQPPVQTASASMPPRPNAVRSNDIMADVRVHVNQMHTVALLKPQPVYLGASSEQSLDSSDHAAIYPMVYSGTSVK